MSAETVINDSLRQLKRLIDNQLSEQYKHGAEEMLRWVRGSLESYPLGGGDIEVMEAVDKIVENALAERRTNRPAPLSVYIIERRTNGTWSRYAGDFQNIQRAENYRENWLGHKDFRTVRYDSVEVVAGDKS